MKGESRSTPIARRARRALAVLLIVLGSSFGATGQSEQMSDRAMRVVAQSLTEAITARDAEAAAVLCSLPTNLDGEVVTSREELLSRWREVLAHERLSSLQFETLEIMTLPAAIQRFGEPPNRLGELPDDAVVAIIRWNRAQLVAVLAYREDRWAVIALTD